LSFVLIGAGLAGKCLTAAAPMGVQAGDTRAAATPSKSEQQAMLTAIRQYAGDYISHLPNFICAQITEQFEAGRKGTHWRRGDTLRSKLVFNEGAEDRTLELVNDRPPVRGQRWRAPLRTEGEFGALLGSVFGGESAASFTWQGWEMVRGRRVARFDFTVDRAHSTMKLTLSDLAHSIVPYHGSVYADPTTGEVWRISNGPFDIPPNIRTKSIWTVIEYDEVPIAGIKYLLPVKATVLLDTGSSNIRNEIWFNEYRKFETDSSVKYTSDGSGSEPSNPNPPE
jgi:hypothetical protein